jgi:hypothetical protein
MATTPRLAQAARPAQAREDSPRTPVRPAPVIGYHGPATLPLLPAHARPRSPGPARAAALLLLAAPTCYGGDFFNSLVDPDATAAFRITQLTLVDPHTYSGDMVLCQDSTATYNQLFFENIDSFDINTTLVLHPLDPAADNGTTLDIVPANCIDRAPRSTATTRTSR